MIEICPGPGVPGLVSVIIPTYNRAHIIGETIESVLAQTYQPIEIIIIDDGSTDNTSDVVAKYGSALRYLKQANAGVAAARNTAFGIARGEFIALIDSDDRWRPWKIELQVAFMKRWPSAGMVWTDMAAINETGDLVAETYLRTFYKAHRDVTIEDVMTRVGTMADLSVAVPDAVRARPIFLGDIFPHLIRGTLVHTPTTLLRRDCVRGTRGYDESLRITGEDFDFHLRTTVQGEVGFLDVPAIDYRVGHADQLTAPALGLAMARAYLKTVQHWLSEYGDRFALRAAEKAQLVASAHQWVGEQALMAGERGAARHHLWRSLRGSPTQPKLYLLLALATLPASLFGTVRKLRRRLRRTP
ncbi:MAG TPA: glycosyltransferase family 2 protein [Longimicrobiales bacterium]|nr:glycosyltransferase family 2 protein [Longimicrobiales bacterium]